MVKIIAALLIIFSCSGFGFVKASEIYEQITFLEKLKRLLIHLRSEINYAKAPMMDAFYSVSQKENGILKEFCVELAEEINRMEGIDFREMWRTLVVKKLKSSPMDKRDLEQFKSIGDKLGYQDYEMQLATIDMETAALDERITSLKEVVVQKQKIYRALGIFTGFIITIIFI